MSTFYLRLVALVCVFLASIHYLWDAMELCRKPLTVSDILLLLQYVVQIGISLLGFILGSLFVRTIRSRVVDMFHIRIHSPARNKGKNGRRGVRRIGKNAR